MNPRVTLGLLAVLLALAGYVYFAPASGGSAGQPAAKEKAVDPQLEVFSFQDAEIQRLAVEKGGQQTVVEKNAEGNWTLQPTGEPADRLRLNGLLLRLSNLRASRRFAEPGSLADYGLATPETVATLTKADGTRLVLELGAAAPAEAGTYAKRADDPAVFIISRAIVQDLDRLIAEPPREPTPAPSPSPAPATPTATP
jgi:hypothetical protein